jgi:hypothetical protein
MRVYIAVSFAGCLRHPRTFEMNFEDNATRLTISTGKVRHWWYFQSPQSGSARHLNLIWHHGIGKRERR